MPALIRATFAETRKQTKEAEGRGDGDDEGELPLGRIPRISRLMALAIRFDEADPDWPSEQLCRVGSHRPCHAGAGDAYHEPEPAGSGDSGVAAVSATDDGAAEAAFKDLQGVEVGEAECRLG